MSKQLINGVQSNESREETRKAKGGNQIILLKKEKQFRLLKNEKNAFGGELFKTRAGRAHPRPLDTKNSMHLVLRSSKANGAWSFIKHRKMIEHLTRKFAAKNGIKIFSLANVGNHLHIHMKLSNRYTYAPFIRGLSSAIAMLVTGASRFNKLKHEARDKFWDYRPYTRVVQGFRALLNMRDYMKINHWEGYGFARWQSKFLVKEQREFRFG